VKDEIRLTLRGLQDKAVGELEAAKREHRKALQVLYYTSSVVAISCCDAVVMCVGQYPGWEVMYLLRIMS
jgi:hypothetical protein